MQKSIIFYVTLFLLVSAVFSAIFPYPIFSNYTNVNEQNMYEINNFNEIEIQNVEKKSPKILDLDFEDVNVLLPETFEIFDLSSQNSFTAKRVGGKNHVDIEPIDDKNTEILFEIFDNNWSWERKPVLVKLNEFSFIPASLTGFPHGYNELKTANGHVCLHFKNSKTDGTEKQDSKHQKCVEKAMKEGKKFVSSLSDE